MLAAQRLWVLLQGANGTPQQEGRLPEKGAAISRHPQEARRRSEAPQAPCQQQAIVRRPLVHPLRGSQKQLHNASPGLHSQGRGREVVVSGWGIEPVGGRPASSAPI